MGASDESPSGEAPATTSEERAIAAQTHGFATTSASAGPGAESDRDESEWGAGGSDWEVVAPAPARTASAVASDRGAASPSCPQPSQQLGPSTAPPDGASSSPELEHAASEASVPLSASSSSLSASDAQEESETEGDANLRRGRQLADTLAAAEAVTAPAYDLALALGEGALAAALEGRAEPYPQLEESEEERDAFEAEFQRVLAEMGRPR